MCDGRDLEDTMARKRIPVRLDRILFAGSQRNERRGGIIDAKASDV